MEKNIVMIQNKMEEFLQKIKQVKVEDLGMEFYVAFGVILVTTLLLFIVMKLARRSKSNTILLAGLSGTGKTVLFYQLRDGSTHQGTVTSMEPNEDTFVLHSESSKKLKPVHVVDLPGHPRMRTKLDEFLPKAAGVVFLVDALDFLQNSRATAEYLYDILTRVIVVRKKLPVLLVCNKADKVTAHSKDFIKKQLEKEIEKLRASRSSVSAADVTDEVSLGVQGQVFSFSQCVNKVVIVDGSALTGDISEVERFIRERVKP